MWVIAKGTLVKFWSQPADADSKGSLQGLYDVAIKAGWGISQDIVDQYRSASLGRSTNIKPIRDRERGHPVRCGLEARVPIKSWLELSFPGLFQSRSIVEWHAPTVRSRNRRGATSLPTCKFKSAGLTALWVHHTVPCYEPRPCVRSNKPNSHLPARETQIYSPNLSLRA